MRLALLALMAPFLVGCGKPSWSSTMRTVFNGAEPLEAHCFGFDDPFENDSTINKRFEHLYVEGWRLVSVVTYTSDAMISRYALFCFERRRISPPATH